MPLPPAPPRVSADTVQVTVLVPAYNEEGTLAEVLRRLLVLPLRAEVIVVDDASTDGTADVVRGFGDAVVYLRQPHNLGKGAAIRAGLARARGQVCIVQDADLEYVPEEIPRLVEPILSGEAEVVYGSRFTTGMHPGMAWPNRLVNRMLRTSVALLYFRRLSDEATCYKAFRTSVLRRMNLVCNRFEFCPEVTAKTIRMGLSIHERPIAYHPRSTTEGKKIRWTDGVEAFWTLLRHRFSRF